jgi:hypothetical protein
MIRISRRELLFMATAGTFSVASCVRQLRSTSPTPSSTLPTSATVSVADFGALPDGRDAGPGVRRALASLPRQGNVTVHFPAGAYVFSQADGVIIDLDGINHLTLEGVGATLLLNGLAAPFVIQQCHGLTIRGFTVDWPRPPFSQGDVISVAPDRRSVDVRIDREFPVTGTEKVEALATFDREHRVMALGAIDAYNVTQSVSLVSQQVLRLQLNRPLPLNPGDTTVLRHKVYGVDVVRLQTCSDVVLEDLVIHAAPGMGIVGGGCQNVAIRRIQVVAPPNTARLMSTCADAIHLASCSGQVEIRDCILSGMGDDGVNIHGAYFRVAQRLDERTVALTKAGGAALRPEEQPPPGDTLEFDGAASLEPLGEATITANDAKSAPSIRLARDLPASLKPGDLVIDATLQPTTLITHCQFPGNRARGVLAHSQTTIERCTFVNQFEEAILLLPDSSAMEGPAAAHVSVTGNTISGALRSGYKSAAIKVGAKVQVATETPHPALGNVDHDIEITDNRIIDCHGAAIDASATRHLQILRNQIVKPNGPAIVINHVQDATIENNSCEPDASLVIQTSNAIAHKSNHGLTVTIA